MLMTVEELKQYITTDKSDSVLEGMLQAVELAIRGYTNNTFQQRGYRTEADILGGLFVAEALQPFNVGDTIQVSQSEFNNGLYVITETTDATFATAESLHDESNVLVTKVVYPSDVKCGAAKMIKWELESGGKVGIQSESISRHSVTYFSMDASNSVMGYPKSLTGFLKPYRKARC